jgi:nodulation protein E
MLDSGLRRVAVTGLGVISAIGANLGEFRASLQACSPGIRRCPAGNNVWSSEMKNGGGEYLAAPVASLSESGEPTNIVEQGLDPFSVFALRAAREAIEDAGLAIPESRGRTAVILGTAVGGDQSRDVASYRALHTHQRPHPLTIVRAMSNAAVAAVSMGLGITGPAFAISSACASGTHGIGEAFRMVRDGSADVALAGGSESLPSISLYRSWQQMRVMSPDGCRPFAADRNGIILGEGAGVLVLEPLLDARKRGARVYCELAGYGLSSDAGDWVNPLPEGMSRSVCDAMASARVSPHNLGYINAHGTGTSLGDSAEAEALHRALGPCARRIPLSSTKALHGHALGASGALEAIATVLGLSEGWVPRMPRCDPDQRLGLNLAMGEPRPLDGDAVLSCSFSFGGLNASLIFRTCEVPS